MLGKDMYCLSANTCCRCECESMGMSMGKSISKSTKATNLKKYENESVYLNILKKK